MKRWKIDSGEGELNILAPSEQTAREVIFGLEGHYGGNLLSVDDGPVFKVSVWVESTLMRGGAYITSLQQGFSSADALDKAIKNAELFVFEDEDAAVFGSDYEMEEVV